MHKKEIADAIIPEFSRIGIPEEILTDQGQQFTANYMQELMNIMDIKHLVTSPYHPICNGLVESFNGTLKQMLYKLCKEQPYEWNKLIDPLLFAYRELPNETTGFSPSNPRARFLLLEQKAVLYHERSGMVGTVKWGKKIS